MTILDQLRADAATIATSLDADFVGTEHLFLAWLGAATGPIADTMQSAGLTADAFRTLLGSGKQRRRGPGPIATPGGLSSQAQRVLDLATELAAAEARTDVDLDDVILAMIREPRGALARALSEFSLKPSRLRSIIRPGTATPEGMPSAIETPPTPEPRPKPAPKPPREPKPKPEPRPQPEPRKKPEPRPRRDPETDDIPHARAPERPRLTPPPKPPRGIEAAATPRRWFSVSWLLFLAVPAAIYLSQAGADPLAIFIVAVHACGNGNWR